MLTFLTRNKISITLSILHVPIDCFKNSFPHCKRMKYLEDIVLKQVTVNKNLVQVRL